MAKQLGRWRMAGPLGTFGARDGALLRSPVTDAATSQEDNDMSDDDMSDDDAQHVHVHLPPEFAPRRTHDAVVRRRPRDQEEPEPGALLCKLMQSGEDGSWSAEGDGNQLEVRNAGDGTLEILHHPGNGNGAGAGNSGEPVSLGMTSPISRDADVGAPGENNPGAAYAKGLARTLAPGSGVAEDRNPGGLQKLMNEHYRRRV